MRTMLVVRMDVRAANRAIAAGELGGIVATLKEQLRPEAAYFYADGGRRAMMFVFDMTDASTIPSIAEPLFTALEAELELTPVMNEAELERGLAAAG